MALGNVGPNGAAALQEAGINIHTGIEGTVGETMQKFKEGRLKAADEATMSHHFGMRKKG